MAKKDEVSANVKYKIRFTQDVKGRKPIKGGKFEDIIEFKKGAEVTCGPKAFEIWKGLGVVEVLETLNKK